MARPRSDTKQHAILESAVRVIAAQGTAAPTALIAKHAGVSNGALFTYFATKSDLLNALYVQLKHEIVAASLAAVPCDGERKGQMAGGWGGWLRWAVTHREKRLALRYLTAAQELTEESREAGHLTMAPLLGMLDICRKDGPMKHAPIAFVAGVMAALADTTVEFMTKDPEQADAHCTVGFEALWRVIT